MRTLRLIAFAMLLATGAPAIAQTGTAPMEVRGTAVQRMEIERILEADNLDVERLTTDQILQTMRGIPRGRAPGDFWAAYEAHIRAWEQFAAAEARVQRLGDSAKPSVVERAEAALAAGEAAIESSFAEVLRIARLYGARVPTPPGEATGPTV